MLCERPKSSTFLSSASLRFGKNFWSLISHVIRQRQASMATSPLRSTRQLITSLKNSMAMIEFEYEFRRFLDGWV